MKEVSCGLDIGKHLHHFPKKADKTQVFQNYRDAKWMGTFCCSSLLTQQQRHCYRKHKFQNENAHVKKRC